MVAFVLRAGIEEREAAFAGSLKKWKQWGGRRDPTVEMHASLLNISFIRSLE